MAAPFIVGLVADNWRTLSADGRIDALQQLETALATQNGREPATVTSFLGEPGERGVYDAEANTISINRALYDPETNTPAVYGDLTTVSKDTPYMAVQALAHESQHAYQKYVSEERPDLAESEQQLNDYQKNTGGGYIQPNESSLKYEHQPTERDARQASQRLTDKLYTNDPEYQAHRNRMVDEEQVSEENAKFFLGSDYENLIRAETYQRHDAQLANQQQSSLMAPDNQQRLSQEEDHDYSQGYGY